MNYGRLPSRSSRQRRQRRGRGNPACRRPVCGDDGPSPTRVCSACKQLPTMTANGPRWNSLGSQTDTRATRRELGDEWRLSSKSEGVCTGVGEGVFCPRRQTAAFATGGLRSFKQAQKWRAQEADDANKRACAVCATTQKLLHGTIRVVISWCRSTYTSRRNTHHVQLTYRHTTQATP